VAKTRALKIGHDLMVTDPNAWRIVASTATPRCAKKTPGSDRGAIDCREKTLPLTLLATLAALTLSALAALTTLLAALSGLLLLLTRLLLAAALLAALATLTALTAALVLLSTLILLARLLFVGVHICSFNFLPGVTTSALKRSSSTSLLRGVGKRIQSDPAVSCRCRITRHKPESLGVSEALAASATAR
jgi:hypothetical protein